MNKRHRQRVSHPATPQPGTIACLTIKQPWAHLIITPEDELQTEQKRIENRTWSTTHRGDMIIHAGKSKDLLSHSVQARFPHMRLGQCLGVVSVVACVDLATIRDDPGEYMWVAYNQYAEGPVCWILANPRPFRYPVPVSGQLGLFYLPRAMFTELSELESPTETFGVKRHVDFLEQQ